MLNGGRSVRAFRPSYFSAPDEYDEDTEREKAVMVQFYAERVEAGLPLFETLPSPMPSSTDPQSQKV